MERIVRTAVEYSTSSLKLNLVTLNNGSQKQLKTLFFFKLLLGVPTLAQLTLSPDTMISEFYK